MEEKEKEDLEKALRESLKDIQPERNQSSKSSSLSSRFDEVDRRQQERTERLLAGFDPEDDDEMLEKVLRG